MLRGRPDYAMAMRLSRLRTATTLLASSTPDPEILQPWVGSREQSSLRSFGEERQGEHAHELFIANGQNVAWGIASSPLLLGSLCISHRHRQAVKHSIECSSSAEESFPIVVR